MSAKDDRPGVPADVERNAIAAFQYGTKAMTGHVWKWEESSEEIRNIWRIKAMKVMLTGTPIEYEHNPLVEHI